MTEAIYFKGELQLNHEASLNRYAIELANEEIENGEETNFDYLYETNWNWIEDNLHFEGFTIQKEMTK